jgi:hypothetical protein
VGRILSHQKKKELGARVLLDAYYTDGQRLVETTGIGASGCVTVRDCASGQIKCLAIDGFRERYWLIRPAAE